MSQVKFLCRETGFCDKLTVAKNVTRDKIAVFVSQFMVCRQFEAGGPEDGRTETGDSEGEKARGRRSKNLEPP
jgi:hypothetical protein